MPLTGQSIFGEFTQPISEGVEIVVSEALIDMALRWQVQARLLVPVLTSWLRQHNEFYLEGNDTVVLEADTVDPPYRADIDRGLKQYAGPVEKRQPYFYPAIEGMLSNMNPTINRMDLVWSWVLGGSRPQLLSEIIPVDRR